MKPYTSQPAVASVALLLALGACANAVLVQPFNYMLDDSAMVPSGPAADGGSLSPFYNDQSGASEHSADKDIVSIIGDSLARLRYSRLLDSAEEGGPAQGGHLSQEMAELLQGEQQQKEAQAAQEAGSPSLSSSVANMLMNVAQAAAAHASDAGADAAQQQQQQQQEGHSLTSRGSIMELDTSPATGSGPAMASKADLKSGPIQWFNPKETIPVLKISSMATPSKYKKVYFRSEKKLVDGAFHSPSTEHEEKKSSLMKPFGSTVQRRSSRGTSSSVAPPGFLQDGVIDFLRKFRDVYVQTRPDSAAASNLASSMVSAAASSPFAAVLAPSAGASSSGSRPNFAQALSAATQMVNSAALVAQAASPSSSAAGSGSSAGSSAAGAGAAGSALAGATPSKSQLTAQSYVSFWSKTFPTWVRKMLKQMRRRSLYNSSKRQQHHHNQHVGQKIASGAVASVVESASAGSGSSSGQSSSSNSAGSKA